MEETHIRSQDKWPGWTDDRDRERALQLVAVARAYYEDDLSQDQIARQIGYSRPTVSRMLQEARRTGIVHIQISHPLERISHLERLIAERYAVHHVLVTATTTPHAGITDVGRATVQLLDRMLRPGMTVGVSNGRTHMALVTALTAHRPIDVTFVQMVGTLGGNSQLLDGPELCRRLADAYGGSYRVLNAPLIAPSARVASALMANPTIASTIDSAARADVAIIGVGAGLRRPAGIFAEWLTPAQTRALQQTGAVGHVLGQFIDLDGRVLDGPHREVVIGMPPERLRGIPHVIAIGAGAEKAVAMAAVLRGGLANSVILDVEAAQELAYLPVRRPAR